jgi:hypothetical protein
MTNPVTYSLIDLSEIFICKDVTAAEMELVEMQNFFGLKILFNQGRSSAF